MTTYISGPTGDTTPDLVLSYQTSQAVPSVVHRIIGRGDPDITLVPAGTRTGTLDLFYTNQYLALNAARLFTQPGVFDFSPAIPDSLAMQFVVTGNVTTTYDSHNWRVSVDYTEVSA